MNNRIQDLIESHPLDGQPKLLAIASGKGGVGKSVIAHNLARALSEQKKVLLVDADFQMGNLSLLANVAPEYGLIDICQKEKALSETISIITENLHLLSSGGIQTEIAFPDIQKLALFLSEIRTHAKTYDFIVFDTASGILPHSNLILQAVDFIALVVTPELTAISDAYALYKILTNNNKQMDIGLLINREDDPDEIEYIYQKFSAITSQFLERKPTFLGWLSTDQALVDSVAEQQSVLDFAPESRIARQFGSLAEQIISPSEDKSFTRKPLSFTPLGADIKE